MKKYILLLPALLLFLVTGCSSSDDGTTGAPLAAKTLMNVSYGSDPQQTMDIYLPAGRNDDTKVIVLVHGGAWSSGSKDDVTSLVPLLQQRFPEHAVVNINYRLATDVSPAIPKQIDDIEAVLDFVEANDYHVSDDFAFIGFSAGAHLSMLYAYGYDEQHDVKAVCNVVGPSDFTDPAYINHEAYQLAALYLIGTPTPTQQQIAAISPVAHITAQSPPTVSFYGGQDPLVPASQGPRLKLALDNEGVYNEFNFYPEGGHGDWDVLTYQQVYANMENFLRTRF